jgi:hypothetical protein
MGFIYIAGIKILLNPQITFTSVCIEVFCVVVLVALQAVIDVSE